MYAKNNPCTRLYGNHPASPNAYPDSPDLEVDKPLKNLRFFVLGSQGEYTYTTPSESREYGPERREKRVEKNVAVAAHSSAPHAQATDPNMAHNVRRYKRNQNNREGDQ